MLMVENYLFWLRIAETSTWRCNLLSLRINQAIWPWDKCEYFFSPHAAWRQHRLLPVAPPTCSSPPCPLFWHRDSVWEGVWFRISMFRPLFLHVFPFCHRFVCVCALAHGHGGQQWHRRTCLRTWFTERIRCLRSVYSNSTHVEYVGGMWFQSTSLIVTSTREVTGKRWLHWGGAHVRSSAFFDFTVKDGNVMAKSLSYAGRGHGLELFWHRAGLYCNLIWF